MSNSSSIFKQPTSLNKSSDFFPDSILAENPASEISKNFTDIEIKIDKSTKKLEKKLEEHKNKEHFCCLNCKTVPIFQFKSKNEVEYKCKCRDELEIRSIEQLLKLNIYQNKEDNNNNEEFMDCFICKKHKKKKKKFSYYCKVCKKNICRSCANKSNEHKEHTLYLFDVDNNDICLLINKILKPLFWQTSDIIHLIRVIIEDFKYYPNYSHFIILKLCGLFLSNSITQEKNIIDYFNKLNNNIDSIKVEKIIIKEGMNNIIDLLWEFNFENLIELNLRENRIKSIKSLTTKKLEKLKILDLAINEIDDSNIEFFFKLDFPELSKLNIFQNKITNVDIFQFKNNKKNLPKLELFYIGRNNINFDEKNINIKKTKYDLSSIKEIGFSLQVFSQKTINFIHCFVFINIEILYLNSNNLENLDFVEDLELPHIKQFWINNNQITNFQPLEKFKTLERIEMENNKIENIDFLEDFFKQVKNLQLFNLKRNAIIIGFANSDFFKKVKEEKKALFDPNIGLFG